MVDSAVREGRTDHAVTVFGKTWTIDYLFVALLTGAVVATATLVDAFTVLLAVITFGLFPRGAHAAYLIVGGGAIGTAWFFLVA